MSQTVSTHDPRTALTLSLLLPTAGDVYMDRYGWALWDLVTWPYFILWSAPSNYRLAKGRTHDAKRTVFFEALEAERTRVRLAFAATTDEDAIEIRRLQEAIDNELFRKQGDRFLDGPTAAHEADAGVELAIPSPASPR